MGLHHRLAWRGGCSADGCGNLGPVDTTATHVCRATLLQLTISCGTGCDDRVVAGRFTKRSLSVSFFILLKKTHRLRCAHSISRQLTKEYVSAHRTSLALSFNLFEQSGN